MSSFLEQVLAASPSGVLVGGQAILFWAEHFDLDVPAAALTEDIDFLGSAENAQQLAERIPAAKVHYPGPDDHTPQSAKITVPGEPSIDYMALLHGMDERKVRKRAVRASIAPGKDLLIASPVDCLLSRIMNLSGRADEHALAQADLSVQFTRRWLAQLIQRGSRRKGYRHIESIADLSTHTLGVRAAVDYGIDILDAVPINSLAGTAFVEKRWPQIQSAARSKRKAAHDRRP